jgi:hypothetical protein
LRDQCFCTNTEAGGYRQYQRTLAYKTTPDILFVQLKIFTQTNRKVPHNITLNPHIYIPTPASTTSTRYHHRATVWHRGENYNDGHYVATAMNPLTGHWITIDDAKVFDPMITCNSEQPYLLAYTLQHTPNSDNKRPLPAPAMQNFFQPRGQPLSSANTRGLPNTGNTCYANATIMMLRHLPAMQEHIKRQHPGEQFDYSACLNRIVLATHSSIPGDNYQQEDLLGREGTFIKATVRISNHGFQAAFKPGNASIPAVEYLIEPDNPLAQAGIQVGDHIIEIDGTALTKWAQGIALIRNLLGTTPRGEHRHVKIAIYRPLLQSAPSPALSLADADDEGYDWDAGENEA